MFCCHVEHSALCRAGYDFANLMSKKGTEGAAVKSMYDWKCNDSSQNTEANNVSANDIVGENE